jgi:Cu2+-containing amine oxidase
MVRPRCPVLSLVFIFLFVGRFQTLAGPADKLCPAGPTPANEVCQEFPVGKTAKTCWRVRFAHAEKKGLYLTGAWFTRAPKEPEMQVISEAGLSELFVPYHTGTKRYYDFRDYSFKLVSATKADAPKGEILDSVVVKEVRDRGIIWKDDTLGRRGEELVLWATLDAANYNYVIQYGFQDDGTITFRVGGTAQNLPGFRDEAHMHNGLWRVDVDLNGAAHNSVMLMKHSEKPPGQTATDSALPFNGGLEGVENWTAAEFTELCIMSTDKVNAQGKNVSYDLMPIKTGVARHAEDFMLCDFWVTRYHLEERFYPKLPDYIKTPEKINDTDVVIWCSTSMHHLPRSEDGRLIPGKPGPTGTKDAWDGGVALLMWSGFDLRPRDVFDTTPFHP